VLRTAIAERSTCVVRVATVCSWLLSNHQQPAKETAAWICLLTAIYWYDRRRGVVAARSRTEYRNVTRKFVYLFQRGGGNFNGTTTVMARSACRLNFVVYTVVNNPGRYACEHIMSALYGIDPSLMVPFLRI
jgi:hypothetical protein